MEERSQYSISTEVRETKNRTSSSSVHARKPFHARWGKLISAVCVGLLFLRSFGRGNGHIQTNTACRGLYSLFRCKINKRVVPIQKFLGDMLVSVRIRGQFGAEGALYIRCERTNVTAFSISWRNALSFAGFCSKSARKCKAMTVFLFPTGAID